jgi:hypothetical protein
MGLRRDKADRHILKYLIQPHGTLVCHTCGRGIMKFSEMLVFKGFAFCKATQQLLTEQT